MAARQWLTGGIGEDEVVAGQPVTGRPQRTGLAIAVGSQYDLDGYRAICSSIRRIAQRCRRRALGLTRSKRACGVPGSRSCCTMPRRGPRRITVIGVGTRPPLPLRPLAMEILRIWEAKQAAARQAKEIAEEDRAGPARKQSGPAPPRVNRLDLGSLRPRGAARYRNGLTGSPRCGAGLSLLNSGRWLTRGPTGFEGADAINIRQIPTGWMTGNDLAVIDQFVGSPSPACSMPSAPRPTKLKACVTSGYRPSSAVVNSTIAP